MKGYARRNGKVFSYCSKDDLEMAMYEFGLKKENVTGKDY